MAWHGMVLRMVEVCEGPPVAVGGWVLITHAWHGMVEVCEGAPTELN